VSHVSTGGGGGGVATLELFWRAAVKAIANLARVKKRTNTSWRNLYCRSDSWARCANYKATQSGFCKCSKCKRVLLISHFNHVQQRSLVAHLQFALLSHHRTKKRASYAMTIIIVLLLRVLLSDGNGNISGKIDHSRCLKKWRTNGLRSSYGINAKGNRIVVFNGCSIGKNSLGRHCNSCGSVVLGPPASPELDRGGCTPQAGNKRVTKIHFKPFRANGSIYIAAVSNVSAARWIAIVAYTFSQKVNASVQISKTREGPAVVNTQNQVWDTIVGTHSPKRVGRWFGARSSTGANAGFGRRFGAGSDTGTNTGLGGWPRTWSGARRLTWFCTGFAAGAGGWLGARPNTGLAARRRTGLGRWTLAGLERGILGRVATHSWFHTG
jgi:hypothetical protein